MNWSISKKMSALFACVVAAIAALGFIAHQNTVASEENAELVRHTMQVIETQQEVSKDLFLAGDNMRGYFVTGNTEFLNLNHENVRHLQRGMDELKKLIKNEKAIRMMEAQEAAINLRIDFFNRVERAFQSKGLAGVQEILGSGDKVISTTKEFIRAANAIIEVEEDLLKQRTQALNDSNKSLDNIVLYGIPVAILFIVLGGYFMTRSIAQPLQDLTLVAENIAGGDLSMRLQKTARSDEIGILYRSFEGMNNYLMGMSRIAQALAERDLSINCTPVSERDVLGNAFTAMVNNLRGMVKEIQESSKEISGASAQIAALSTQLATSSAETAAAVNETGTTIEEIKVTAQQVNQKSAFVSERARENANLTESGRTNVAETINGMSKIRQQVDFIASSIVKLSEQSMAIGEIITSVNDLAGQSNLLAVNASIEAAKAGEHGKGFAVVAQEVRSLADQSKDATEQVKRILNEIQKAISSAVMATEQGGKTVEISVKQSSETERSISTIEQGASATVQAAAQILASTNEQVVGLNQVALAMDNILKASQQIVTSTRQAETATGSLNEMGRRLWHLVERFKVN
ncbi:MAG: methyl-accepting chemotaxis protein [Rhodoferax sp.]|nr:methyl-accepting chemotaxis protein [Rhodoferax sp.]